MKKNHGNRGHAEFGASKSKIWLNCAGAIQLAKKAPPRGESPYAEEGTKAHEALDYALGLARKISLRDLKKDLERLGYTEEMIEHAVNESAYILSRVPEGALLLNETEVDSSHFTKSGQFGTVDAAIVEEFGRLIVIDYKYGAGVVEEPEENTQAIYYALALSKRFHHNFTDVEIMIIQPRAPHAKGHRRSWVISMPELLKWENVFKAGVKAAEAPNPPLKSGEHCRWCTAKPICPAISQGAVDKAKLVFAKKADGEILVNDQSLHGLPTAPLSTKLKAADALEIWIKAVREFAEAELYAGRDVPGYKLVAAKVRRKWIDETKARKTLYGKFGPRVLVPQVIELKSPNQLEETFGKKITEYTKKLAVSVSSGLTMVNDSDKRSAVNPAKEAFKNHPKEKK